LSSCLPPLLLLLCAVLSAVSGLKVAFPAIQQGEVIGITMVVLILLFSVQYLGTAKISAVFAPVIAVWLLFNAAIGFYNLSTCGWGVWQVGMRCT
jgi:KUP system potassium uptake protein